MGRIYAVTFENVSISAAQELFYVAPADDKPLVIHGVCLSNVGGAADAGDAQEELLRILVRRGHTSVGSGGTAPTPAPYNPADAAAGFTARVNDTTIASSGTPIDLMADGWNVRVPYVWLPTPELRPLVNQGQGSLVVRLVGAPADAISVSGTLWVEEL